MEAFLYNKICKYTVTNKDCYFLSNIDTLKSFFQDSPHKICCILSKNVYSKSDFIKETNLHYNITEIGDCIYLTFRGTSNLSDVIKDIKFTKKDDTYGIPGRFHKGFHDTVLKDGVAEKLLDKIIEICKNSRKREIYITGHSLGGACATIFYSFLKMKLPSIKKTLVTFGCPRVGDSDFSKSINESFRYVNGGDIVTKIPNIRYHHIGKKILLGKKKFFPSIRDHDINKYLENLKD